MNTRLFTLITLVLVMPASFSSCIKVEFVNPGEASGFKVEGQIHTLTPTEPVPTDETLPTATRKPTATATPAPTNTPLITITTAPTDIPAATATATPTVTEIPIISEQASICPGVPAISIKRNALAQISLNSPKSLNVRSEPGLKGKRIGMLTPGEPVLIVDGPRCADNYTWWFVRSLTGLEGWTAVGDATGYWIRQPLDAFFYDTVGQSSASKVVLDEGQKYRLIMSGTYSLWVPKQWTDRGVCIRGKSELRPMFPSLWKTNGRVGADPYYQFARPFYGPCQYQLEPGETISKMMFSLDGGNYYSLPIPLIAKVREDHTYTYEVIGQGYPLIVRLDDAVLDDNYGQIFVTIEKIN
jgi:hypothetical protein